MQSPLNPQAPIGVFDSGIGGLSVLRALRQRLPLECFIYVADAGHAPYGEKTADEVIARSQHVTDFLRQVCDCKAMVIACNTATAIAASHLRSINTGWPIVGIEPAIKPAAKHTRTGAVGVLATQGTLRSAKYQALRERVMVSFAAECAMPPVSTLSLHEVACMGLAAAIEDLAHVDRAVAAKVRVNQLITQYLTAMGPIGHGKGQVDTLVLGCTHYPLVAEWFAQQLPAQVRLLDPGDRVASHTVDVLRATGQLACHATKEKLRLWSSGNPAHLAYAAHHWLDERGLTAKPLPC